MWCVTTWSCLHFRSIKWDKKDFGEWQTGNGPGSRQVRSKTLSHLFLLPSRTNGDAEVQAEGGPGPPTGPQTFSINPSCCPSLLFEASLRMPPNLPAPRPLLCSPCPGPCQSRVAQPSPALCQWASERSAAFISVCPWGLFAISAPIWGNYALQVPPFQLEQGTHQKRPPALLGPI